MFTNFFLIFRRIVQPKSFIGQSNVFRPMRSRCQNSTDDYFVMFFAENFYHSCFCFYFPFRVKISRDKFSVNVKIYLLIIVVVIIKELVFSSSGFIV